MSEALRWESLTEQDYINSQRLLTQKAPMAWFGSGRPCRQYTVLVTGLQVPRLPAPMHGIFWTSEDTGHAATIENQQQSSGGIFPVELYYGDPDELTVRGLRLEGTGYQVPEEELPLFVDLYNHQRTVDGAPPFKMKDFKAGEPQNPDDDIAKRLYVAGFTQALLTASRVNEQGMRRRQGHLPVALGAVASKFVHHDRYPDLRFGR